MGDCYSFNHNSFGKTTNRAGAAGDNVRHNGDLSKTQMDEFLAANAKHLEEHGVHRSDSEIEAHLAQLRGGRSAADNAAYNARLEAAYAIRSHIIPPEPEKAAAWFDQQEKGERKNARMSDRFIGALPRELTPEQCIEAVEAFCRGVTKDRVPWHFALHLELEKRHEADWNPHTHIVFRDRDIETGRRYLYTTAGPKERRELDAKGIEWWSTKKLRVAWQEHINHALERAGHDVRIDHRSYKERGIDKEPQIHIGPGSQNAAKKGRQLKSRDHQSGDRVTPYSLLDQGSRAGYNAQIIEANKQREGAPAAQRREPDPEMQRLLGKQAEARRTLYQEQRRDRDALKVAQNPALIEHRRWARKLYAGARNTAYQTVKEQHAKKWKEVRAIRDREDREVAAAALKAEQKKAYGKEAKRQIDLCKPEKDAAWKAMCADHKSERGQLRDQHRQETEALFRQQAAERLGMLEKRRAEYLEKQATTQQSAAHKAIKLYAKASKAKGYRGENVNPREAVKEYFGTAWVEQERQKAIRQLLLERRASNLKRAGPNGQKTYKRRQMQHSLRHAPVIDKSANRRHPRDIVAPGIQAAKGGKASDIQRSLLDSEAQNQIRQAAMTGRTLNDAERVSAPPEIKHRLSDREQGALAIRNLTNGGSTPGDRIKGRGGGGRGR